MTENRQLQCGCYSRNRRIKTLDALTDDLKDVLNISKSGRGSKR